METNQIVVFKLKGHEFGIDIKKVLEILNYEPVRPVPAVPSYVEGIINVRGNIYPIYNLRKRLNMSVEDAGSNEKIILLHLENNKVGFLVDNVAEILNIEADQVEEPPKLVEKNKINCIEGIIKQEDKMVIVLDVDALISDEDELFLQGVSDEDDSSSDPE